MLALGAPWSPISDQKEAWERACKPVEFVQIRCASDPFHIDPRVAGNDIDMGLEKVSHRLPHDLGIHAQPQPRALQYRRRYIKVPWVRADDRCLQDAVLALLAQVLHGARIHQILTKKEPLLQREC
jgi:hypothetical protein